MNFKDNKKIWYLSGFFIVIIVALMMIIVFTPQEIKKAKEVINIATEADTKSFTFFDISTDTALTETIRKTLSDQLGSETVAESSPIDLSMNYQGFLQKYSKELSELNYKLNDTTGARIEHNTFTLTYRYPPKDKTLFDYVRLMFSNYSKKPLLFIISAEKEASTILDTLIAKYGEPKINNWDEKQGVSYHWQKGEDILILSQSLNRIGNPEFNIHIYFEHNINELLLTEKREVLKKEQEQRRVDREAF